ncbi:unnamed protein product [Schistosoma margrebowiei]|uniref:Dihydropteridine reductase n=1 Tax=Schistosoma margrebowiei TaxID=48269 RepID=A0A3P8B7C0_9TREM|nr:unnamed protein product [Schistosoma margrebowiei]
MMSYKRVLLYGGRGCLGSVCVKHFKNKGYNSDADENIVIEVSENSSTQERVVKNGLDTFLSGQKVDGIFCVADFLENCDAMWKKCVWSSSIAAALASKYLLASGLLVLTGAHAALQATPSSYAYLRPSIVCRVSTFVLSFIRSLFWCVVAMLGYGMAKAAVHQLTKSLAGQNSGLPNGSCVLAISPATLDTPMNRKWMPNANHSSWTPTEKVAELFATWLEEANSRPKSGSIIQLITQNGITECVPV